MRLERKSLYYGDRFTVGERSAERVRSLEPAHAMYVAAREPLPASSEAEARGVMVPLSGLGIAMAAL